VVMLHVLLRHVNRLLVDPDVPTRSRRPTSERSPAEVIT
jgi:hypothetical protein